jgi:hypothetical protein
MNIPFFEYFGNCDMARSKRLCDYKTCGEKYGLGPYPQRIFLTEGQQAPNNSGNHERNRKEP